MPVIKDGRWSLWYECCQGCGTSERPHVSKGLCQSCSEKARYWANGRVRQRSPRGQAKPEYCKEVAAEKYRSKRASTLRQVPEVEIPLLGRAKLIRTYELDGEQVADVLFLSSGRKLYGTSLQGLVAA